MLKISIVGGLLVRQRVQVLVQGPSWASRSLLTLGTTYKHCMSRARGRRTFLQELPMPRWFRACSGASRYSSLGWGRESLRCYCAWRISATRRRRVWISMVWPWNLCRRSVPAITCGVEHASPYVVAGKVAQLRWMGHGGSVCRGLVSSMSMLLGALGRSGQDL